MGYIIFIRHAESTENVLNDNSGTELTELTKRGHEQAKHAAKYLASHKFLGIKRVVSSGFKRAIDTAKPIAKALGLKVEVDTNLREGSNGIIDGVKFDDIIHLTKKIKVKNADGKWVERVDKIGVKLYAIHLKLNALVKSGRSSPADPLWQSTLAKFEKLADGEPDIDIYKRVDRAVKKYGDGTLFVSHGGSIGAYLAGRYNLYRASIGSNYGKDSAGKDIKNCHISIINTKTGQLETMLDTTYFK
jgi:broad specificity phosphatase PhoE